MKLRYLGHSCFLLTTEEGQRIVTDPYGDIGYPLPPVRADFVTVSHGHFDHCNVRGVSGAPEVFDRAGEWKRGALEVSGFPSFHDEVSGAKRGKNTIFRFRADGLSIVHLGDLGVPCSDAMLAAIPRSDVLLIPVGGIFTIDAAQAVRYIERLAPAVAVPMHFGTDDLGFHLDPLEKFLSLCRGAFEIEKVSSETELCRSSLGKNTKIIVMEKAIC